MNKNLHKRLLLCAHVRVFYPMAFAALVSRKAKNPHAAKLNAQLTAKYWLERGFIEPLHTNSLDFVGISKKPFFVTKEGASFVDYGDWKPVDTIKSAWSDSERHEYAKTSFLLSMLYHYSDRFSFEIIYPTSSVNYGGVRPDAHVIMREYKTGKERVYLVENQTSYDGAQAFAKKMTKYKHVDFAKTVAGKDAQVLTVYSSGFPVFAVPQEYDKDEKAKYLIDYSDHQFDLFMKQAGVLDKYRFRFMRQKDWYRLNEEVWEAPDRTKLKIIRD